MIGMMKDILKKRKGAAFLFLVLMIIFTWTSAQAQEKASITVEPASGKAAAVIKIKGTKFKPGEEVHIVMQVGDVYHGLGTEKADVIVADAKGEFDVSSGIPVRTPPGIYKIEATGNKGSEAAFNIEVLK